MAGGVREGERGKRGGERWGVGGVGNKGGEGTTSVCDVRTRPRDGGEMGLAWLPIGRRRPGVGSGPPGGEAGWVGVA